MSTPAEDIELRRKSATWFEGEVTDCDGLKVKMHSVVTPVASVSQYFAPDEAPIVVEPGRRLVVVGAAGGDLNFLWLDIDDPGPWVDAHICLESSKLRYLCEAGEPPHTGSGMATPTHPSSQPEHP